ncbi:MAG: hypothetical protein JXR83_05190 [Deltaproteobacteria bacterium]|nr:hypothetical protein [Deltaproteobacteria bacterium]
MRRIFCAGLVLSVAVGCNLSKGGLDVRLELQGRAMRFVNHQPLHDGRVVNYASDAPRDANETQSLSFNLSRKRPAELLDLLAQDRRSIAKKILGSTIEAEARCLAYEDRWGSRNVAYIVVDRDGEVSVATLFNRSAKALPAERDREYGCDQAAATYAELHRLYQAQQALLRREITVPFLGAKH